jgi:hypothetical protein
LRLNRVHVVHEARGAANADKKNEGSDGDDDPICPGNEAGQITRAICRRHCLTIYHLV